METNGIVHVTLKDVYEAFINMHKGQFQINSIPELYWNRIFDKIKGELFDAGQYFQIIQRFDEDDEFIGLKAVVKDENGLKTSDSNG